MRLLIASVGPLETRAQCQLTIWVCQRARVRPRRRSSGGQEASCEVVGEFGGVALGELRTVDVIEAAEGFFGVPRQAHLAVGVAGGEQAAESGVATFAEAFVGGDQQTSRPIQGIVPAAAAAEGVVLGAPAHLVDAVVGQADDVERVGDLAGPRQRCFEGAPVGAGEVQHAPVDAPAPHLGLREEPRGGTLGVATRDNVEQLTPVHVDDRGAPVAPTPPAVAPEQGLIETQGLHRAHTAAVGGQQCLTPDQHRPVRRVPVTTQLGGHIRHRTGVAAHRHRRPPRLSRTHSALISEEHPKVVSARQQRLGLLHVGVEHGEVSGGGGESRSWMPRRSATSLAAHRSMMWSRSSM